MFPIVLLSFIKDAFFHPERLPEAASWKRKSTIRLFLLLSFFISIPFLTDTLNLFSRFSRDTELVLDKMPAFTIENGTIHPNPPVKQAIIVKTESLLFVFDPFDQYSVREERRDMEKARLGLIIDIDSFLFQSSEVPIRIDYTSAEGLTDEFFRTLLSRFSNRDPLMILVIALFSFLTGMVETAIRFLFFTLLANIVAALMRRRFNFGENWRMMMVAGFVPTVLFVFLNAFSLHAYGQLQIIGLLSLYLYYRGLKETPKI